MIAKNSLTIDIKKRMTISEVSDIVGVSCKTLTRLEKAGKTPKAKRDWRGWRVYDENDLLRIKSFFETVFEVE
jgi:DNA-binding transcriptional MerR regulator